MNKKNYFLILFLSLLIGNCFVPFVNGDNTIHKNNEIPHNLDHIGKSYKIKTYTEHAPIMIDSNADFIAYGCTGNGTIDNPYIIQELNITAIGATISGIKVTTTTAYFEIKNCLILSEYIGILLNQVAFGTGKIIDNICISSTEDGGGILLSSTNGCNITGNECANFMAGIHLNNAGSNIIDSNIILNNHYQGINIRNSDSNNITYNLIFDSEEHGLALIVSSYNNIVHHNFFINNSKAEEYTIDGERTGTIGSQGYDEGTNNIWYDAEGKYGNHWSDYKGRGDYAIDGPSNSVDIYPLTLTNTESYSQSISSIISAIITIFIGFKFLNKKKKGKNIL